jgi:hypothetical protein
MREDNSRRRRVTLTTAGQFENTDMGEENARKRTGAESLGNKTVDGRGSSKTCNVGGASREKGEKGFAILGTWNSMSLHVQQHHRTMSLEEEEEEEEEHLCYIFNAKFRQVLQRVFFLGSRITCLSPEI